MILEVNGLKKYYGKEETLVKAVDSINLKVKRGEFLAIVGTSGSGKTTLLNLLGGLDKETSGEVIIEGKNILRMSEDEKTIFRRRNIGFIFQNYNLMSILNIEENILLPLELDGEVVDLNYFNEVVETLGIKEKLNYLPSSLSGGQRQRVAIGRALITKPSIILADEPTGSLDGKTENEVLGLLKMTSKRFSQTIIMITHNEKIAQMADRVIRIEDGKIVEGL
ncbi:MAG: ABC transporter ATP-binding protein [Clostridium sp.]